MRTAGEPPAPHCRPAAAQDLPFSAILVNLLFSVIDAKAGGSVDDDTLERETEALVQALEGIRPEDIEQAVAKPSELLVSLGFAHICSQVGSGKVKGVNDAEGGSTGSTP